MILIYEQDSVRPKTAVPRYYTLKSDEGKPAKAIISIKFKKTKDPDPGSYNV